MKKLKAKISMILNGAKFKKKSFTYKLYFFWKLCDFV